MDSILKFRRLKHGDPRKFKVLAEDIRRERGGLSWTTFALLVIGASILAFAATVLAGKFPFASLSLM
jgi:hypothetical protein